MLAKTQNLLIVVFWIACVSWLVWFKIAPALVDGDPPTYVDELATPEAPPPPVVWKIYWKDKLIGHSVSKPVFDTKGEPELRHVTQFEGLPIDEIFRAMLGEIARLFSLDGAEINVLVANRMNFETSGDLLDLETVVNLEEIPKFIEVNGVVDDKREMELRVSYRLPGSTARNEMPPRTISLPPGAAMSNSLSPRSRMNDLKLGQKWTMRSTQPLSPQAPVQVVQAEVTRHEILFWEGDDVETFRVEYRPESGIRASRKPISIAWVTKDGLVIQQDLLVSNLKFRFKRMSNDRQQEFVDWVEDEKFDAYFNAE